MANLIDGKYAYYNKKASYEHMPIRGLFQRFSPSSRPISRILSGAGAVAIISLGCAFPHSSCGLPGTLAAVRTAARETSSLPPLQERLYPCLALLPIGVTWPPTLLRAPVVSYTGPPVGRPRNGSRRTPTFSPLPGRSRAVCFCGPIRQVAPPRELPGIVLYGVRTFLDPARKRERDHPASLRD
jgi:hypothetical protein